MCRVFAYLFAIAYVSFALFCIVSYAMSLRAVFQWEYHVCRCHACDIHFFAMISFML